MKFEEGYKQLNKEQKKAVDTIDGPVLVVAGPGSGKTQVLALRVANILRKTDTPPENILCLTFTDAAALNMRERLVGLIGEEAHKVGIHTFHGFGVEIMARFPEFFYGGASFQSADEVTRTELLREIFSGLSHDNPLSSLQPEKGYVYLEPIKRTIGYLKKGGITPAGLTDIIESNKKNLEFINPLIQEVFAPRMSKETVEKASALFSKIKKYGEGNVAHAYALLVADSLSRAVSEAQDEGKTGPLTAWKTKWVKKNDQGEQVFKDELYVLKFEAVAKVYQAYQDEMYKRGYYDFDDMLLNVLGKARESETLRYEIQEHYQYVLVDEFQDTNEAQMAILRLIGSADVNEGRPNIMAVGDDDQAIYKFQGAELSNILDFRNTWRDPAIIVLTKNYRSHQDVLDLARYIILKGEVRLENEIDEVNKELTAGRLENPTAEKETSSLVFETSAHEYGYIARETARLIKEGTKAEEIAVIARKHKNIAEMLPYFAKEGVAIRYDQKRDVFLDPHIHQLIAMAHFVTALSDITTPAYEIDTFLPEILSYPFWGISRDVVWDISLRANDKSMRTKKERSRFLAVMEKHEDAHIVSVAKFLRELAEIAVYDTWEVVFGKLVGATDALSPDSEHEDETTETPKKNFVSPFKEYYFSKKVLEKNPTQYIAFLSGLRIFAGALREYRHGVPLKTSDVIEFVDMHRKNNLELLDKSSFVQDKDAVHLTTVHSVKGLEFSVVFVASCQNEIWAGRGIPNILPLPLNLPFAPAGDTRDDQLRLFYVALTRARDNLYLTLHKVNAKGKTSPRLQFLDTGEDEVSSVVGTALTEQEIDKKSAVEEGVLLEPWSTYHLTPVSANEKDLLEPYVKDYHMPVTHLNNFLDVTKGGPQNFFEMNLLRFPQPKNPAGAFGSAMHKTMELWYEYLREHDKQPTEKMIIDFFEDALRKERMAQKDETYYMKKGKDALTVYYKQKKDTFDKEHLIETDFRTQGVVLGGAHITGKIDKMVRDESELLVVDYKTGKARKEWKGAADYEKVKDHNQRRQLLFYKLLVENSRDFSKYNVKEGVLEFLEPVSGEIVTLPLEIEDEDVVRTRALIEAVYKKITNLDFPDIGKYSKDIKGILAFEEDLLSGAI